MFTGIIQDVGRITALDKKGDWTITITTQLPLGDLLLGASIACNGICVTAIEKGRDFFKAQFSSETLDKTTAKHWAVGQSINLERALRGGDELGGHYVSGHVDGVARLADKHAEGDSVRLIFEVPAAFAHYVAPKGSITLDGVSLTVNEVSGNHFGVNLIPHTLQNTTFGATTVGNDVNFEIDMIARYVERLSGRTIVKLK
jgi:riboflavin synthase